MPDESPSRIKITPHLLESQRKLDRYSLVAAEMRAGKAPPCDLVLDELRGWRETTVKCLKGLGAAVRENADPQTIGDNAALFGMLLWALDRCRKNAPNVTTYVLERWPILSLKLAEISKIHIPNAAKLSDFDSLVGELDTLLEIFIATIEKYGLSVEDRPAAPESGAEPKPRWDEITSSLLWQGKTIKQFSKHPAYNQRELIEAFEKAGWVRAIPNPLGTPRKLSQTIQDLMRTLPTETIRFCGDGVDRAKWEPAK